MPSAKAVVLGVCGCSWLIVAIVLIAVSFATVSPHEYGLRFDNVNIKLDVSRVYPNGRWHVGVGSYFVKFPRSLSYMEFSNADEAIDWPLDVWSKDGQSIYIEAGFYYLLNEAHIFDLYYTHETSYERVVEALAAETLRDVSTGYDTLEFFTNRSDIDRNMQRALSDRLYTQLKINVTEFNLLAIDVPDAFERAVLDKSVSAQDVLVLGNLRQSQVIRTEIAVISQTAQADITLINATAAAVGLQITKSAEAEVFRELMQARATELAAVAADLGFASPADVLQYLYTDVVRGNARAPAKLAVDFGGSFVAK